MDALVPSFRHRNFFTKFEKNFSLKNLIDFLLSGMHFDLIAKRVVCHADASQWWIRPTHGSCSGPPTFQLLRRGENRPTRQ